MIAASRRNDSEALGGEASEASGFKRRHHQCNFNLSLTVTVSSEKLELALLDHVYARILYFSIPSRSHVLILGLVLYKTSQVASRSPHGLTSISDQQSDCQRIRTEKPWACCCKSHRSFQGCGSMELTYVD